MPGNHPPAPSQARAGQITRRSRPWTGLLNACLPCPSPRRG